MNPPRQDHPMRPLYVDTDGIGQYRSAYTVDDLAALLLNDSWPHSKRASIQFHRAVAASIDALESRCDAEIARREFVAAAHANGLHILPDDAKKPSR